MVASAGYIGAVLLYCSVLWFRLVCTKVQEFRERLCVVACLEER